MFDEVTTGVLTRAGWFPGRSLDIDDWVEVLRGEGIGVHAAADAFLREFGGLAVEAAGPGITRARESYRLDPTDCVGEGERFLGWSEEIGRQIVPVGQLAGGRFFLGIDETSEIYAVELNVLTFGQMPVAMERLTLGVMPEYVA